jgi:hypothetical protein
MAYSRESKSKFTESDAPPTGKMCEYDSRKRGEVKKDARLRSQATRAPS